MPLPVEEFRAHLYEFNDIYDDHMTHPSKFVENTPIYNQEKVYYDALYHYNRAVRAYSQMADYEKADYNNEYNEMVTSMNRLKLVIKPKALTDRTIRRMTRRQKYNKMLGAIDEEKRRNEYMNALGVVPRALDEIDEIGYDKPGVDEGNDRGYMGRSIMTKSRVPRTKAR